MSRSLLAILLLILTSCVSNERGRTIATEEIAWIQKGATTRTEVVQKFGTPYSEVPDGLMVETTTTPTTTKADGTQTSIITSTVRPNKYIRAIYLHTKTEGGFFMNTKVAQEQFWVRYDERGVVQDFGLDRLR
jgi:outer membrane protein assembly factor BamE (lipoprotein component of BamABCDE complex)